MGRQIPGRTHNALLLFYDIECALQRPVILIFKIYKSTNSTTLLPGLIYISQAVAEKWAMETLEKKTQKLF